MPIISIDVNAPGMSGVIPKAIFIDTNDTAAEVVVAGYLDHIVSQGIPIANWEIALVTTRPTPNSSDITTAWYGITFSNGHWNLVSQGGGASVILPTIAKHIATYNDTVGTLTEDPDVAITGHNLQALGNITAGDNGAQGALISYGSVANSGYLKIQGESAGGNFTSTIESNEISQNTLYTLPITVNSHVTVMAQDGNITPGHLLILGTEDGTVVDGGIVPTGSGTVNSGTANQVAYYASSTNAVSGLSTTARAAFTSNSTGIPSWVALTDGQIVVGSTAGSPAAATLTAGTGITITSASNSITVASTGFQSVTVSLTSANIKSMFATPIQLIAPPGAHKMIVVTDVCVEFNYVAPVYVGAGSWGIQYGNAANFSGNIQIYIGGISLINPANDLAFVPGAQNSGGSSDTVDYINLGVFISNDTSAYTLGNGILNITLKYYVVNTTA